ncbi:hypothetical protein GGE24_005129 [Bradyrhizobium centrosematis]|nr:hypothetical protein [Bradyrhizobium centrosematis]MCS3775790.1 hypothetical protein [Bradyrhizobium centrosematis]
MLKKPATFVTHDRRIVLRRVLRKRLGDKDACIVDQRVYAAETGESLMNDTFGCSAVGDVARNGKDVIIAGGLDGARRCHDAVIAIAKTLD